MKIFCSLLFVFILCAETHALDRIYLKDGGSIKCRILELKHDSVYYSEKKSKTIRLLTSETITFILVGKDNTAFLAKMGDLQIAADSLDACETGRMDAKMFHHREFGNGCLGFFFGPFGVIGVAIFNPHPPPIEVVTFRSKEMIMNPEYLKCFKKRARGKNVIAASVGFGLYLVVYAILNSSN